MSRHVSGVKAGRREDRLAAESPKRRMRGRRLAEEGDVTQTGILPNSCGKIQQNAIKDKFFILLSCRRLGKIP